MIRHFRLFAVIGFLTSLLAFLSGCSETLKISSNVTGATVMLDNGVSSTAPADLQLQAREQPYLITVTKEGFEARTVEYKTGSPEKTVHVTLSPLVTSKSFTLTSQPEGATVTLGNRQLGRTPCTVDLNFRRSSSKKPWEPQQLTFTLADHQSESVTVREDSAPQQAASLALLRAERSYRVITKAAGSLDALAAPLTLNGKPAGSGPEATLKLVFSRAAKTEPWPEFSLSAQIHAVYQPLEKKINFESGSEIEMVLDPVTEVPVVRHTPSVVSTPTGPKLVVTRESRQGTIDTAEPGSELTGLTRVTDFPRRDLDPTLPLETLNSYTILPLGTHAIIAVTTQDAELARTDPEASYSSHLELRSTTEGVSQRTQLTSGLGYLDTAPVASPLDGAQPIVIFQSNRGDLAKPDLFRLQLDDRNTLMGGIARITTDSRLNYGPSCADTNRVIVYLSTQPNYARALPQLCTITKDGALPTQFPINAIEANQRDTERIYFTRRNDRSGKFQIYYVQSDGKLETQAVGDSAFAEANCFNPCPSYSKGGRVLFVSDRTLRKDEKPNNNIYVMNADGTGVQRVTGNTSDDILPTWSPLENEPDVIYFISNRGGSYNLWRAQLVSQK